MGRKGPSPDDATRYDVTAAATSAETTQLIDSLNEDLRLEFRSIIQFVQHISCVTGAEYTSTIDELKVHLAQELDHASVLAEQIAFLGGAPATTADAVPPFVDSKSALQADLDLETGQLERYRARVQEATDAGLPDVAEALRPLLTETQEHVRDLQTALGQ
jgi:bacterioferritin